MGTWRTQRRAVSLAGKIEIVAVTAPAGAGGKPYGVPGINPTCDIFMGSLMTGTPSRLPPLSQRGVSSVPVVGGGRAHNIIRDLCQVAMLRKIPFGRSCPTTSYWVRLYDLRVTVSNGSRCMQTLYDELPSMTSGAAARLDLKRMAFPENTPGIARMLAFPAHPR